MRRGRWFPVLIAAALTAASVIASCAPEDTKEERTAVIFLTRHGQTEANLNQILQGGGSDSQLTGSGRVAVTRLGEALSSVKFGHAFTSELGRAKTTAEIILDANTAGSVKKAETLADLNDIDWGDAENRTISDVENQYGPLDTETYIGSADDSSAVSLTGGESCYEFCTRFDRGIQSILDDACNNGDGGNILITAHSSAAYWLQTKFPDAEIESLDNASVTIIRVKGDSWELLDQNDVDYAGLPDKLKELGL